jgi:hypothetical protein
MTRNTFHGYASEMGKNIAAITELLIAHSGGWQAHQNFVSEASGSRTSPRKLSEHATAGFLNLGWRAKSLPTWPLLMCATRLSICSLLHLETQALYSTFRIAQLQSVS